jgi:hypothetical protein
MPREGFSCKRWIGFSQDDASGGDISFIKK